MPRKKPLFYINESDNSFAVLHRQIIPTDSCCAIFFFYNLSTVSKTRARRAAKVFCKQMNSYYPTKVTFGNDSVHTL